MYRICGLKSVKKWTMIHVLNYTLIGYLSAVFHECRADNFRRFGFGCPPGQVIRIYSAKVGNINFGLPGTDHCWLSDDDCSWQVYQTVTMKCNEQQWCHLSPEVYNKPSSNICSDTINGKGDVIKITYNCITDKGLLLCDPILLCANFLMCRTHVRNSNKI